MIVRIKEELYNNLIMHSSHKLPEEACGFILGEQSQDTNGEIQALTFIPFRNCASDPRNHFEISPKEMIPYLMESKNPVIGIFHSHPSAPPVPSYEDLQTLWHAIPTYWILSLKHPKQPKLQIYQIKKATQTTYNKLPFVIGQ